MERNAETLIAGDLILDEKNNGFAVDRVVIHGPRVEVTVGTGETFIFRAGHMVKVTGEGADMSAQDWDISQYRELSDDALDTFRYILMREGGNPEVARELVKIEQVYKERKES